MLALIIRLSLMFQAAQGNKSSVAPLRQLECLTMTKTKTGGMRVQFAERQIILAECHHRLYDL